MKRKEAIIREDYEIEKEDWYQFTSSFYKQKINLILNGEFTQPENISYPMFSF